MVVFAPQNLVMEPPFTRLDLLVCRNLLIYLSLDVQKKLIPLFHYCLNPGGILFLGSAETIGAFNHLFSPLERKLRLYRRVEFTQLPNQVVFPPSLIDILPARPNETVPQPEPHKTYQNLQTLADQVLLKHFTPAAVLVNLKGDILYVSGRTGKYLELAAGKANWNVFAMAREELRYELSSAFHKALNEKITVTVKNLAINITAQTRRSI